ncbi:MAG TPA: GTP-dependent dephospho-CoA kinase family protein [Candidatus Hodarchaeales archaeon]|nr:GTP-dependent dephospho-CoA kinase family protein [Candidatus Hodarchaeales archaeon]
MQFVCANSWHSPVRVDLDKFFDGKTPIIRLPASLRSSLKIPMGELFVPRGGLSPQELVKQKYSEYDGTVVTVGDVVTGTLIQSGLMPNLAIIDGQTLRGPYSGRFLSRKNLQQDFLPKRRWETVENPQATLTRASFTKIQSILNDINQQMKSRLLPFGQRNLEFLNVLLCSGEEDLLVIPSVFYAPSDNSLVMYGQPGQGIVVVKVDSTSKTKVTEILSKFEA